MILRKYSDQELAIIKRYISCEALMLIICDAVVSNKPLSIVRFSDGERAIMRYSSGGNQTHYLQEKKWLEEYGSLENIIHNADRIPGKVGEYLRSSIDQFPLTRKLVTLKCDVELGIAPEQPYVVEDLLDGARYTWQGAWNYVKLDPAERMAHVFVVR